MGAAKAFYVLVFVFVFFRWPRSQRTSKHWRSRLKDLRLAGLERLILKDRGLQKPGACFMAAEVMNCERVCLFICLFVRYFVDDHVSNSLCIL